MTVDVVHVGHMRMRMRESAVPVEMGMRFPRRICLAVLVAMMFVVHMGMRMRHRLVNVLVLMPFGKVQPNAQCH